MSIKIGILGSTGYTGCQLVSILLNHPEAEIIWLTSEKFKGLGYSDVFPGLAGRVDIKCVSVSKLDELQSADLVFSCLPNITSMHFVKKLCEKGSKVIDLSSDFRIKDTGIFKQYFNKEHPSKGLVDQAVYGLPELNRENIKGADLIANPGCFATTVLLSLAPLLKNGIEPANIVADIKAPISGAGRAPRLEYHFPETNQNITGGSSEAYYQKLEVKEFLNIKYKFDSQLIFNTHRVNVKRGILTSLYCTLGGEYTCDFIHGLFIEFYSGEKFVRVRGNDETLQLKNVLDSNYCDISISFQENCLLIETLLDNTFKGASGQAVQNMNIIYGLGEDTGLSGVPLFP